MVDPELERAIAFSRGGKKLEARQVLKAVLQTNLQNESAWLWMADTYAATEDRIKVLEECLKHIPESQVAQKWLATFKAEKEARLAAASQETLPDFQAGAAETVKTDSRTIFDQQLDCSGLDCPIPILRTKKALD
jgi:thioredoxin-like negative regulator of GroEL